MQLRGLLCVGEKGWGNNNRQTTIQSNIWIFYIFRDTSRDSNENSSERLADNGDSDRDGVQLKARNVNGPRLIGALGGGHGDGRGDDVGDVVGLVVDAESGRGNGDSGRGARRLDELIARRDPTAEKMREDAKSLGAT